MASKSEEQIRLALEEVLKLYDIKLENPPKENEPNDYSEIIGKTQARLDDLNEKAEEIFKRTGMTREQLFDAYRIAKGKGVSRFGLHTMVVSNELDSQYFVETARMLFTIAVELREKEGIDFYKVQYPGDETSDFSSHT